MKKNRRVGHPVASRVIFIVYDAIAANLAYILTFLSRFYVRFDIQKNASYSLPILLRMIPLYALVVVAVFYLFRMYHIRWQYGGLYDLIRIAEACLCTGGAYAALTLLLFRALPHSVYLVAPLVETFLIGLSRVIYKLYLEEKNHQIKRRDAIGRSLVIGADAVGCFAVRKSAESGKYRTAVMLDPYQQGPVQYINGLPVVCGLEKLEGALKRYKIGLVVIADQSLLESDREAIKALCRTHNIEEEDFIEYLQNNNNTPTEVVIRKDGSRVIPFSPPDITEKEVAEVRKAMLSGWITTGPRTKELEKRLAAWVGTNRMVCLSSQTAAAETCLRILGIGEGDEVITCAYTYTASASVAIHVGAKVVLVDCAMKPGTIEMDYDALEAAITERTKVIIPVDLGGIPCDYDRIYEIVGRKRALFHPANDIQAAIGQVIVVSDAAHALGSSYHGRMVGTIADFTNYSFHAVKNFTTAEGGAMTWKPIKGVEDEAIYRQAQLLSLHGQSKDALSKEKAGSWDYDIVGPWYKCNMTDISAAIGLVQLDRYPEMLAKRKAIIKRYDAAFRPLGIEVLEHYTDSYQSCGHLYITRVFKKDGSPISDRERREIIVKMAERGVATNVHYKPFPLHTAYRKLGFEAGDYPVSIARYENEITLPLHTRLSDEDVAYVIRTYTEVLKEYI